MLLQRRGLGGAVAACMAWSRKGPQPSSNGCDSMQACKHYNHGWPALTCRLQLGLQAQAAKQQGVPPADHAPAHLLGHPCPACVVESRFHALHGEHR